MEKVVEVEVPGVFSTLASPLFLGLSGFKCVLKKLNYLKLEIKSPRQRPTTNVSYKIQFHW